MSNVPLVKLLFNTCNTGYCNALNKSNYTNYHLYAINMWNNLFWFYSRIDLCDKDVKLLKDRSKKSIQSLKTRDQISFDVPPKIRIQLGSSRRLLHCCRINLSLPSLIMIKLDQKHFYLQRTKLKSCSIHTKNSF